MKLLKQPRFTWAVVLLCTATNAYAGTGTGGVLGKKATTVSLFVSNTSSNIVGVYYDSTNAAIQAAITANDPTAFMKAGGVILNPGGKTTFSVKPGTYSFVAVPDGPNSFFPQETAIINIQDGHNPAVLMTTNNQGVNIGFAP